MPDGEMTMMIGLGEWPRARARAVSLSPPGPSCNLIVIGSRHKHASANDHKIKCNQNKYEDCEHKNTKTKN